MHQNSTIIASSVWAMALLASSAAVAQSPVEVTLPDVAPSVERITLSGSFAPRRRAALSAQVAGLVAQADFEPGDRVTAGTVLVQLDASLADLRLARADAEVARNRAAVREARRLVDEANELQANQLFPKTELRAREAGVELSLGGLAVAQAERNTLARERELHSVTVPFDGVIARRLVDAGEWVGQGTAVADVVDPSDVWLELQAPQSLWPKLDRLRSSTVRIDALGADALPATLAARVPQSDPGARTFLVRLKLTEPPASITPGMSATASLAIASTDATLLVPRDALIRYPDGTTTVFVVEDGESTQARQRTVEVTRVDGETAVIASGLNPGEPVVIRGNEVLSDGQSVRVIDGGP